MIHPYFLLPPPRSPSYQQQHQLPSLSMSNPSSPSQSPSSQPVEVAPRNWVYPPGYIPHLETSQWNQPLENHFRQWIPEMQSSSPPHQSSQAPSISQAPCSQTTSPRTTTPLNGLPTIPNIQSLDQLPKDQASQVNAPSPPLTVAAQKAVQDADTSAVEGHGSPHSLLVQRASSKARGAVKPPCQKQAEVAAWLLLSTSYLLID